MKRTNIYLGDKQKRSLEILAGRHGLSVAELVRRAVDMYLDQEEHRKRGKR